MSPITKQLVETGVGDRTVRTFFLNQIILNNDH